MNTILLKILLIFIKHDKTLSIPARMAPEFPNGFVIHLNAKYRLTIA